MHIVNQKTATPWIVVACGEHVVGVPTNNCHKIIPQNFVKNRLAPTIFRPRTVCHRRLLMCFLDV